jgi:uncharacterized membrane protein YphA (DoxX/SURF4 family)
MDILLVIHSIFRWVVVLAGLVALVKFAIGWLGNREFSQFDDRLSRVFPILVDIQVTLGIILLIWGTLAGEGLPLSRVEHAVIMLVVAFVAHMTARWGDAPDAIRFRNRFLVVLGTLLLIFVGVTVLPGGLSRWM